VDFHTRGERYINATGCIHTILQIIMGSGFDDWVYWHFFTVTINYYSSHTILTVEVPLHSASHSMTLSLSLSD
jgi:hypothetical protein